VTSIGDYEDLLTILHKQLNISYIDREVHLLKSLVYLIKKRAGCLEDDLSLYGTKNFAGVWESICKNVINSTFEVNNIFPNPEWNILGSQYKSKGTLIPDIILEDENGKVYLFDAKYYSLKYIGNIAGEPGYKDIIKQFQYQQHIEEKRKECISNAFLFPLNDKDFISLSNNPEVIDLNESVVVIGSIKYDLFKDKKIWVMMCSYSSWQMMYIQNKMINYKKLFWNA
ncbi:MAG: LlaJI family restriction endonuclease, partial [Sphingobacteriaceae bacterium]